MRGRLENCWIGKSIVMVDNVRLVAKLVIPVILLSVVQRPDLDSRLYLTLLSKM